jgi:NADH:ubiquinone oxidoreductase subunit E
MHKRRLIELIGKHREDLGGVITILEEIQTKYGCLSEEALRIVAQYTGRSLVDIYGIATFYKFFSLKPRGNHLLLACLGTACHVRGGPAIVEEFVKQLGISPGETTADRDVTFETVNCLGACALGPIVIADGHYFSNVTRHQVKEIISKVRAGIDWVDIRTDERIFPVEVSCPRCNRSLMARNHYIDGYPSIEVTLSFEDKHGWLRLSCLYGSYSVESEYTVPKDTVVDFFCPHCSAELVGISTCANCGASMVPLKVHGGGIVQICSRRGCKGHMLDLGTNTVG